MVAASSHIGGGEARTLTPTLSQRERGHNADLSQRERRIRSR